ncbi:MAG: hypothetical protein NTW55_00455 [Planctomycetota bacterium]|nr:hypothetical protein [Planctomycetota bacterium]
MLTSHSKNWFGKWYIYLLAAYYSGVCGIYSIYYLHQDLIASSLYVPWRKQAVCFAATVSAILYFFKPNIGFYCLLLSTLATILFASLDFDIPAIVFHTVIFCILTFSIAQIIFRFLSKVSAQGQL